MKKLLENSFKQLLLVYSILVFLIALNIVKPYSLNLSIFALFLATLSLFSLSKYQESSIPSYLIIIPITLIIIFTSIPYINNSLPLGYDAGIYQYSIDLLKSNQTSLPQWTLEAISPAFLALFSSLSFIPINFLLIQLQIFFFILLASSIYLFSSTINKKTALLSILIFSISIIQLKFFSFMYYKNLISLSLLFISFYLLNKNKPALFILTSSLIGAFHLPTFLIFTISITLFFLFNNKKSLIYLIPIFLLFLLFYINQLPFLFSFLSPLSSSLTSPGLSPGTFISFSQFLYNILPYLPLSILGFFLIIKRKNSPITFLSITLLTIVSLKFFFFNRFIIPLDLTAVILAAFGISKLKKDKIIFLSLSILFISSLILAYQESSSFSPIISESQIELIKKLNQTEENSSVIAISSEYSPYVLAHSQRKTIAPGLFEENKWTQDQWERFWQTQDKEETISLLNFYQKPIYLFAGNKTFNNSCFTLYNELNHNKILKYTCDD